MPGDELAGALQRLAERGVTSMVLEGGATLHRGFWKARCIDTLQMYVAPIFAGGEATAWLGAAEWSLPARPARVRACGPDVRMEFDVHGID